MAYPPADDRLRHLIAQEVNTSVATWKLAFWIAGNIIRDPEIRAELRRIEAAHAASKPCGDRHCDTCFNSQVTADPETPTP